MTPKKMLVLAVLPWMAVASRSDATAELERDPRAVFKTRIANLNSPVLKGELPEVSDEPGSRSPRDPAPPYVVTNRMQVTTTFPEAEEQIAVDPTNTNNLVAVVSDFSLRGGYNTTKYAFSLSNGDPGSWVESFVPLLNGFPVTGDELIWEANSDPVVAIDRDENAFMVNLYFNASNSGNGIYVSNANLASASFAFTANNTVAVVTHPEPNATISEDKPWIAVDNTNGSYQGNVYVSWTRFEGNANRILFSRSSDHGQSFSDPVQVSLNSQAGAVQGSQIAVGSSGEVYVAYEVFYIQGYRRQFIAKSTDGGSSFAAPVAATPYFKELRFSSAYRKNSFPSLAASPLTADELYFLYSDQPNVSNGAQVEFVRSTDGGATFSSPVVINDVSRGQQFMPALTVDNAGALHASWFDTRNSASAGYFDVYATRSVDHGLTFSQNARVTRSLINASTSGFIGDYAGIAAADGFAHPVWTSGGFSHGAMQTATLQ